MRRFAALALGVLSVAVSCQAQSDAEIRTTVDPLPDEDIRQTCEYRLVPPAAQRVRAVWVIFDRGQDYLRWYLDPRVRAFAVRHELGLMLATHCPSKEREDMIVLPTKGVGRVLFTALDQFAAKLRRAELSTAPIIAMGWSGAGSLAARLAGYRTERYLAGIAYAPGQYEPLGMDTIDLEKSAIRHPQLIIANGGDNINGTERPYNYFRKHFEQGAPWTFVVQNRTPHCCLQNAQTLILEWLHGVLSVTASDYGRGQRGFLIPELSNVHDDWKRPVFNAAAARIAERNSQMKPKEIPAGWMPSSAFAAEWQMFVSRTEPLSVWKP